MCKTFKVTKENAIGSLKGACGGFCNRSMCENSEAFYYNQYTFMYYCRSCALATNPYGEGVVCFDIAQGDAKRKEAREKGIMPI